MMHGQKNIKKFIKLYNARFKNFHIKIYIFYWQKPGH